MNIKERVALALKNNGRGSHAIDKKVAHYLGKTLSQARPVRTIDDYIHNAVLKASKSGPAKYEEPKSGYVVAESLRPPRGRLLHNDMIVPLEHKWPLKLGTRYSYVRIGARFIIQDSFSGSVARNKTYEAGQNRTVIKQPGFIRFGNVGDVEENGFPAYDAFAETIPSDRPLWWLAEDTVCFQSNGNYIEQTATAELTHAIGSYFKTDVPGWCTGVKTSISNVLAVGQYRVIQLATLYLREREVYSLEPAWWWPNPKDISKHTFDDLIVCDLVVLNLETGETIHHGANHTKFTAQRPPYGFAGGYYDIQLSQVIGKPVILNASDFTLDTVNFNVINDRASVEGEVPFFPRSVEIARADLTIASYNIVAGNLQVDKTYFSSSLPIGTVEGVSLEGGYIQAQFALSPVSDEVFTLATAFTIKPFTDNTSGTHNYLGQMVIEDCYSSSTGLIERRFGPDYYSHFLIATTGTIDEIVQGLLTSFNVLWGSFSGLSLCEKFFPEKLIDPTKTKPAVSAVAGRFFHVPVDPKLVELGWLHSPDVYTPYTPHSTQATLVAGDSYQQQYGVARAKTAACGVSAKGVAYPMFITDATFFAASGIRARAALPRIFPPNGPSFPGGFSGAMPFVTFIGAGSLPATPNDVEVSGASLRLELHTFGQNSLFMSAASVGLTIIVTKDLSAREDSYLFKEIKEVLIWRYALAENTDDSQSTSTTWSLPLTTFNTPYLDYLVE